MGSHYDPLAAVPSGILRKPRRNSEGEQMGSKERHLGNSQEVSIYYTVNYTASVQNLEFLKKSWHLSSSFPDLEDVWKNGKKSFFFLQSSDKCFRRDFFFILVKSYSNSPICLQHTMKIAPLIMYLITLSPEREIIVLKKAWKKSWILNPNICTGPDYSKLSLLSSTAVNWHTNGIYAPDW